MGTGRKKYRADQTRHVFHDHVIPIPFAASSQYYPIAGSPDKAIYLDKAAVNCKAFASGAQSIRLVVAATGPLAEDDVSDARFETDAVDIGSTAANSGTWRDIGFESPSDEAVEIPAGSTLFAYLTSGTMTGLAGVSVHLRYSTRPA